MPIWTRAFTTEAARPRDSATGEDDRKPCNADDGGGSAEKGFIPLPQLSSEPQKGHCQSDDAGDEDYVPDA
jgi:hypothetical protein